MKLIRSVTGTANSFSDEISTGSADGPSQDAETVSVYLGHSVTTVLQSQPPSATQWAVTRCLRSRKPSLRVFEPNLSIFLGSLCLQGLDGFDQELKAFSCAAAHEREAGSETRFSAFVPVVVAPPGEVTSDDGVARPSDGRMEIVLDGRLRSVVDATVNTPALARVRYAREGVDLRA